MNPFFIFLFVCTLVALIFWFKNASSAQGIVALKGFLILIGLVFIVLVVTGRLPILAGIPIILAALFRKFALNNLLIPLIKLMAGSYISKKAKPAISMNEDKALKLLQLDSEPSREQIVQAHRRVLREMKQTKHYSQNDIDLIDRAREFLIANCKD